MTLFSCAILVLVVLGALMWASKMADESGAPATETPKKVRKKRTPKTLAERRALLRKQEENLAWDAAKDVLGKHPRLKVLAGGRALLKKWVTESETYNDPVKLEEIRTRLQERLANLDKRAAIARTFLKSGKATVEGVERLFVAIGAAIMEAEDSGTEISESDVLGMVDEYLPNGGEAALLFACDPANDPYKAFRRAKTADGSAEESMPDADEDSDESDEDSEGSDMSDESDTGDTLPADDESDETDTE